MPFILILVIVLAVLLVVFTLQNPLDINLTIYFWELNDAPLVLVLMACTLIGFLLSSIYFLPKIWRLKKENKQLVKFSNELEAIKKPEKGVIKEEINPEGILMDDEDDNDKNSFFKD